MSGNPILRYFDKVRTLPGRVFDDPRAIRFRKILQTTSFLTQYRLSSIPTAGLYERIGSDSIAHVLWLQNEGAAVRGSSTYQDKRRAVARTAVSERGTRVYLNRLHRVLSKLKAIN